MTDWRDNIVNVDRELRPLPSRPADWIEPVPLAEPPVLAVAGEDITLWRVPGAVVLRIGAADDIGAECIEIPRHLIPCVAATLAAEADGLGERGA